MKSVRTLFLSLFFAISSLAAAQQWTGNFSYDRSFSTTTAGCLYRGAERLAGTLECEGAANDLRCRARGDAAYEAEERTGAEFLRTDTGKYEGPIAVQVRYRGRGAGRTYDLWLRAPVRVTFRKSRAGETQNGAYKLDLVTATDVQRLDPAARSLSFAARRPIFEPGPKSCAAGAGYNGTSAVQVKLRLIE